MVGVFFFDLMGPQDPCVKHNFYVFVSSFKIRGLYTKGCYLDPEHLYLRTAKKRELGVFSCVFLGNHERLDN